MNELALTPAPCVNETADRMNGITGIEFGPNSCVLVRARRRDEAIELSAGHVIEPERWPEQTAAAAELLKNIRREHAFPRVARVVAWGLAEGAGPRDPATRAALRPLISAGFRIESVFSPAHALALLAATRPRGGAAAVWLAINRNAAAIAIVRGAELLYSRAFGWNWEGAAIGSQAQLLQRYSIVAHLAPEIRRGIELVRTKFDVAVEAAITCGDLPDLRSLTMPLIDELDIEVETLDSVEGLIIPPLARREHLPDSLAAVRLACAAAAGPVTGGISVDVAGLARAAAVIVAVGGLAWVGYVWWMRPQPPAPSRVERLASTAAPSVAQAPLHPAAQNTRGGGPPLPPRTTPSAQRPLPSPPSGETPDVHAPATALPPASAPSPVPSRIDRPRTSSVESDRRSGLQPVVRQPQRDVPTSRTLPLSRPATSRPQAASERRENAPQSAATPARSIDTPPDVSPAPRRTPSPAPPITAPASEQSPPVAPPPADTPAPRAARPAPLKNPLPAIETILVSSDRRIAVIDGGAIVGVGDTIGPRTIVRIEVDAIYLREPSGLEIRVPIRVRR
jgi:hypothetical protein